MSDEELIEAAKYPKGLGQEEKQPNLIVNLRGQYKYDVLH